MYDYRNFDHNNVPFDEISETDLKSQNMLLARAYIINQPYGELYSPKEALHKGSVFTNMPINYEMKKYR
ncbi:spore coat associated protein CotJA [Clostridium sp. 19966]|uniref:spore coat associated protein CotJA n=1 Tax=Clostridium sp. 19966 TaxID=2768166 RepID=UPI0028E356D5|nr:spore coat associated protein CotJA [Clostridium sp. 19966]